MVSRQATMKSLMISNMAACLLAFCIMSASAFAQEAADAAVDPQETVIEETTPEDSSDPFGGEVDTQRQQNLVSILMILLAGVGIVGVLMIGAAMIWGAHVRRIVRHVEHPPTKHDELWYMRRPPLDDPVSELIDENAVPPSSDDTGSTPDRGTAS